MKRVRSIFFIFVVLLLGSSSFFTTVIIYLESVVNCSSLPIHCAFQTEENKRTLFFTKINSQLEIFPETLYPFGTVTLLGSLYKIEAPHSLLINYFDDNETISDDVLKLRFNKVHDIVQDSTRVKVLTSLINEKTHHVASKHETIIPRALCAANVLYLHIKVYPDKKIVLDFSPCPRYPAKK